MNGPVRPIALSVVLPLVDHRGHAAECVTSWTRGQTLGRERYEVLVVGGGREPEVEAAVQPILTSSDRFLPHAAANEVVQHDHGARQAAGRWLVFAEAHCVAAPTCLAELLAYLQAHESRYVGACLRSTTDDNPHPLARLEERWYQDGFAEWSREGDWRKVTIRGFAVRRDVYVEAGGFRGELGCFAETVLAAAIHARGYRLGYAAAATVKHYNSTSLRELLAYVREYREGEVACRAHDAHRALGPYFGWSESDDAADVTGPGRRRALAAAARGVVAAAARPLRPGSAAIARAGLGLLLRAGWDAVAGGRGAAITAVVAYGRARAAFARPGLDREERYRRYRRLWDAAGEVARQWARARQRPAAPTDETHGLEYRPGAMRSGALLGFHGVETWSGQPFRWSGPLAVVPVSVPAADYDLRLETNGLRGGDGRGRVDVYLDGRRAAPADPPAAGCLAFRLDRAMFRPGTSHALTLVASRLRVRDPAERRALGLPVFRILFTPSGQARP
jgi:Glycosyltransferase like family 2